MSTTYEHAISYRNKGLVGGAIGFKMASVTASFKELDRNELDQHKLAMQITKTFRKFEYTLVDDEGATPEEKIQGKKRLKTSIDDESVYDLTVAYIRTCSVYTSVYDEGVRNDILADVGAIYNFGMWALGEKIAPFFASLLET